IEDRINYRAQGWNDCGFTDANNGFALVFIINKRNQLRHLERAGKLVVAKPGIELHPEPRIDHTSFPQSHAERLNHAAIDLTLYGKAIKRQSDVLHVDHLDGPHMSCLDVDFDFS